MAIFNYQRKALSTLYELGIILIEKRGLPAKNYYKINFDVLLSIIEESSCQRRRQQDTESVNLNNNKQTKIKEKEKVVSKDTTTEFSFGKKSTPKKENLYTKCVQLIDSYDFSCWGNIREQLIDYLNFRLAVKDKPLYTNMWKGMLNKLANLCVDDISKYEQVIQYSLERGYLSFYEPKNFSSGTVKSKPWEQGVKSETYTEEEKREIERITAEREARGEQVWY